LARGLAAERYGIERRVDVSAYRALAVDGLSREEAKAQVERISKDVLTNPVIEEFRFEILD